MTIALEALIRKLTVATPSGGKCRIGDAFISVWYCPDIWEWEYLGETFWDVQDLAQAITQGSAAPAENGSASCRETGTKGRSFKVGCRKMISVASAMRFAGGRIPGQAILGMRPGSLSLGGVRLNS
jgi:hypothetical protein